MQAAAHIWQRFLAREVRRTAEFSGDGFYGG
jgi:hypothetical protein